MNSAVITLNEYQGFQRAYDFFNRELFADTLPQVLVTLQRHANTRGYFSPERFKGRVDRQTVHELALNPDNFTGRTDEMILSTLVHEMAHVWQETYGEPSRRGYHNRQWAEKMRQVGLQPTATGFYEPDKIHFVKPPFPWHYFQLKDQKVFGIAGLYDVWKDRETGKEIHTYTIITTEPNAVVGEFHGRMPVILQKEDEETWLNPDISEPAQLLPLLKSYPDEKMETWPVGEEARNPRNDYPELMKPISA